MGNLLNKVKKETTTVFDSSVIQALAEPEITGSVNYERLLSTTKANAPLLGLAAGSVMLCSPSLHPDLEKELLNTVYAPSSIPFESVIEEDDSVLQLNWKEMGADYSVIREDLVGKILSFNSLRNNWDGYGAIPPEAKLASRVVSFLFDIDDEILEFISDSYPNPNGTIELVWKALEMDHIEYIVEFGESEFSSYLASDNSIVFSRQSYSYSAKNRELILDDLNFVFSSIRKIS